MKERSPFIDFLGAVGGSGLFIGSAWLGIELMMNGYIGAFFVFVSVLILVGVLVSEGLPPIKTDRDPT